MTYTPHIMIKRKFDRMLSEGQGKQLLWLSIVILIVLLVLLLVGRLFGDMTWQFILALFMDPGNFALSGTHDFFRILIVLLGAFLFSALLISVISNIFENISLSYKRGENRYSFSGHVLIIGAAKILKDMLCELRDNNDFKGKHILIMTSSDVEILRKLIELSLSDTSFCKRITYFHRSRQSELFLREACADKASCIYVIGEEGEQSHDALNIRCLSMLKNICVGTGPTIPCYVTVEMHSTFGVFNYTKNDRQSRLSVEIVNEYDYMVEQLLTTTDYLPALKQTDKGVRAHIVIIGHSTISRAFATISAQMCHYPNFNNGKNRTLITFVEYSKNDMYSFVTSNKSLFDLCHYRYVSPEKTEEFEPQEEYGDFLDIEWEFVDGRMMSPFVRSLLESWISEPSEKTVLALCLDHDEKNAYIATHLPSAVYREGISIAVCQNDFPDLMTAAKETGMFGNLYVFGKSFHGGDPLYLNRSAKGKRLNWVCELEYGTSPSNDEDEAWKKLIHAHKYSSVASANSIPLKMLCLNIEPTEECLFSLSEDDLELLSEMEHRRWMTTQLFLGYAAENAARRKDRSNFNELKNTQYIHLDIAPYKDLPGVEKKDKLIINNIPYIMTGSGSPIIHNNNH